MQIAPWAPGRFRDLSRPSPTSRTIDRPLSPHAKARTLPFATWTPYAAACVALLFLLLALRISAHWPFVDDHALGRGPAAWLAWDGLNGTGIMLAMTWIAGQNRRIYGVIAGTLALLAHLANGPQFLGQPDWTVALLIALSAGCLFHFARREQTAWVGCAFLFAGLAATITPPAGLIPIALLLAVERERWLDHTRPLSSTHSPARLFLWVVAGSLPALLGALFFLHSGGAVPAFINTMGGLMPYYASLHRSPLIPLIRPARVCLLLLGLAFLCTMRSGPWRNFQINLLMLCSACGITSYVLQGEAFSYALYPALPFLFLWVVLEIAPRSGEVSGSSALPRVRRSGVGLIAFVCVAGLLCLSMVAAMYSSPR